MHNSIKRRKFLIDGGWTVLGAGALDALLTACGDPSTSSPGSRESIQLSYWALGYEPKGANMTGKLIDAAISAFSKEHAGVMVTTTGYTGDQAGYTKLANAVQGGGVVDVFRLPSDVLAPFIRQNVVAPIDDYLTISDQSDIFPQLLAAVASHGKHYAWPLWVPPVAMYLNLDIFREREIAVPPDNWTYEQFVAIAQKLTFKRRDGQQVYGYACAVDPGVVNAWSIIMCDGGLPLNKENTRYTFNSPEGVSGLQKLVNLAQKYRVTPPDFGTQSPADMLQGFEVKRNYAMYSEPSGSSVIYKAAKMNFAIKPMPIGGLKQPLTTGGIGLISVATIQDANRFKAAMQLARYLTSSQVGRDIAGYYLAPGARKSVTVGDPVSRFSPLVSSIWIPPIIVQWPQIRQLLHTQIQDAILGKISASAALNQPANEINAILSGANG